MSRAVQFIILCLAISGIRGNNAPSACCITSTPSPIRCPAEYVATTTTPAPFVCPFQTSTTPAPFVCPFQTSTTPAPFVCPFQTSTTPRPTPTEVSTPSPITAWPSHSTPSARNPDPNPSEAKPNYVVVPANPGIPNMPWYPYPMYGNYMPILEDPKTGQRYYVMPNPNRLPKKYTQTLNIFSPDMYPGYYVLPSSSTEAPQDGANKNGTSPATQTANS